LQAAARDAAFAHGSQRQEKCRGADCNQHRRSPGCIMMRGPCRGDPAWPTVDGAPGQRDYYFEGTNQFKIFTETTPFYFWIRRRRWCSGTFSKCYFVDGD
jgi:hypothetical protein